MHRKGLFILALMLIGMVVLANAARQALSQQPLLRSTQVNFEQSFTLGGPLQEDLVAVAETVHLPADSRVTGNVAVIADVAQIDGPIDGDLTVMANELTLGPDAQVNGNATLLVDQAAIDGAVAGTLHFRGDQITLDSDAHVSGDIFACADTLDDQRAESPRIRPCDESNLWSSTQTLSNVTNPNFVLPLLNVTVSGAAIAILCSALGSLALSGLSILAVVLFPRQISHIEEAIRTGPRSLGGTGLMILALAAGVTFALIAAVVALPPLGLVLVPVYLLAALLFFGMTLAGWITVTLVIGDYLLHRVSLTVLPPLVIAAVGNISLLLAWNLLALTTWTRTFGIFVLILLGAVGLGATFVTRLGTRPMHRSYLVQG
ncbi:MAG: polymer-forming cytoskeletal protein [Anaerolineae bacterium]|nr:polymer-forming cytoskeletal protein [Anaerolineae bacterium]